MDALSEPNLSFSGSPQHVGFSQRDVPSAPCPLASSSTPHLLFPPMAAHHPPHVVKAINVTFSSLFLLLLTLMQIKFQSLSTSPFQTHPSIMLLCVLAALLYALLLMLLLSEKVNNSAYLTLIWVFYIVFGTFACDFLLLILIPGLGWIVFGICVLVSLKLMVYDSHGEFIYIIGQASNGLQSLWNQFKAWMYVPPEKSIEQQPPMTITEIVVE